MTEKDKMIKNGWDQCNRLMDTHGTSINEAWSMMERKIVDAMIDEALNYAFYLAFGEEMRHLAVLKEMNES